MRVATEHIKGLDLIFQGSDLIRQLSLLLCSVGVGVATDAVPLSWGEDLEDWARVVPRDREEEMDFQRMWVLRLDEERERGRQCDCRLLVQAGRKEGVSGGTTDQAGLR